MTSFTDALARLREVATMLPEDDPDRQEMLSVEGNYTDLMEWALRKRNEFLAQAEAINSLADTYTKRCISFGAKADNMKSVVKIIMDSAGERKYQGIAATVSIRAVTPKPIITDETLLPERFFKTERNLVKSLVNEAAKNGETIPGVTLDNGGETISIRSK